MIRDLSGRIASDPEFQAFQRRRNRFNGLLTAAALGVFFIFILTIAFVPEWLAVPLAPGSVITRAIPAGFGVMLTSLGLIGCYVVMSNRVFDPAQRTIVERAMRAHAEIPDDRSG